MRDVHKRHCGNFADKHDGHVWRNAEDDTPYECTGSTTHAERAAASDAIHSTDIFQTCPEHNVQCMGKPGMCPEPGCTYVVQLEQKYDGAQEVQRWADAAMFRAEPMEQSAEGRVEPKVYLLSMTPDPLGVIAAACKMYKGEVVRDMATVTDKERQDFFAQIQKTHLQAPFEFVDFHFMIEGVTRAFTHQMVRQRTAVYAQESLRFAVKEDAAQAVALPPSLALSTGVDPGGMYFPKVETMRAEWDAAVNASADAYNRLVALGMPAEDARGLLPHSITTRLHYKTNLRNLMEHAGNRLCTQAQFEWRQVWMQIVQAIRQFEPVGYLRDYEGLPLRADDPGWQQEVLSNLFRPICYLTGKCEFRADFDRACSIRSRVDANGKVGRTSDTWDTPWGTTGLHCARCNASADAPQHSVLLNAESHPPDGAHLFVAADIIPAISPAEWLLDPTAARS